MDKGFAQSDQAGYDHWINTRRRTVFVTLLRIYLKIRILVHIEERIILPKSRPRLEPRPLFFRTTAKRPIQNPLLNPRRNQLHKEKF